MSEREPCRLRLLFAKEEPLKYISHLDLLRAWERILRRASLPLSYSQGFNPHPKLTIAMPLPVGCSGEHELIDVILDEPLPIADITTALRSACPAGLSVLSAEFVPLKAPSLPSLIRQATYEVTVAGLSAEEVRRRADDLLARSELQVEFRDRIFDLRPLVGDIAVQPAREDDSVPPPAGTPGMQILQMTLLRDATGRIGRPDVLLEALGLAGHARRIRRTDILFAVS